MSIQEKRLMRLALAAYDQTADTASGPIGEAALARRRAAFAEELRARLPDQTVQIVSNFEAVSVGAIDHDLACRGVSLSVTSNRMRDDTRLVLLSASIGPELVAHVEADTIAEALAQLYIKKGWSIFITIY